LSNQQVFFLRFLFCLFLVVPLGQGVASATAHARPEVSALVQEAHAKGLARHPYWFGLLHYQQNLFGKVASDIVSPDFFLAPAGVTDPAAELAATVAALFEPVGANPDDHAQCRFVARFKWLQKVLDWGASKPPAVHCPRYRAYAANEQIESVSLVYATGYLSNPASFYGHILLKFNTRRTLLVSELLDQSLNYGAIVPSGENAVIYVTKGLFGGYDASFSHQQFFNFNHLYVENDLRDLWEYELALTAEEVDQLVSHTWEILGKRHVYYFLKDNCAYRMARLLQLVIGEPLLPELPWSLPGAVFERLDALERNGAPLVRTVRHIPSRQNRFRDGFVALTAEEQSVAREVVDHALDLGRPAYRALADAAKIKVVDTLLDYYEYRIAIDRTDTAMGLAKHKVLVERAALPARQGSGSKDSLPSDAAPPQEGPLPLMLRFGPVRNSRFGSGIKLRARPVNYDSLALDAGRIPNSTLTMFDVEVVHLDNHWSLRRFDVVNVENLNVAKTPLAADGAWAWKFKAGLQSQDLECRSCTVAKAEGGIGKALALGRQLVGFGMVDLWVQTTHANSGTLAAVPRIGLIGSAAPGWKTLVELGRQRYLNGEHSGHRITRWENRFGGSRRWDVRLAYEEHVAREISAAVSLYW
jgi:hypothetical protein